MLLVLFALIIVSLLFVITFVSVSENKMLSCVIVFFSLLNGIVLTAFCYEQKPKAMDVYKGKTTLEYTYKDSVAVDSVVVFKNKEYKSL